MAKIPVEERFWSKVHKTRSCWLWTGRLSCDGHGYLNFHGTKTGAYRVAWILTYGAILPGVVVCHRCTQAACVRPAHLRLGTQSDNAGDRNRKAYGSLRLLTQPPLPSAEERFWAKVDTSGDCWLWTGARNKAGYGGMDWNGKRTTTHRIAWEIAHGPIPNGLVVRHLICDNPRCVRIEHLALGSHADNNQDMLRKNRHHVYFGKDNPAFGRRQSHCKKGHPLQGDNVIEYNNVRRCRICTKAFRKARWQRLPQEEKSRIYTMKCQRMEGKKRGIAQGENHGLTSLTALQVYAIRTQATQPSTTFQSLANTYGVSPTTIANIVHRKTWKYLPEIPIDS